LEVPHIQFERVLEELDLWSGPKPLEIAVLLPCYNEALVIETVIRRFGELLPDAKIYVYDNNSTDGSADKARQAGAIVRREPRQGKGFVVRRMFTDIDADIYIMCDADETYDASAAPALVQKLIAEGLDMVVGTRVDVTGSSYRPAHLFGNRVLTGLVGAIFGRGFSDMLSGYRIFSRRFVKSFPLMSRGFEIETELTIHALQLEMPVAEVPTQFKDRVHGSESKLQTVSDGVRIMWTIFTLLKQERPFFLFGSIALALLLFSLAAGSIPVTDYMETGLVNHMPLALLATGTMILATLSLFCGLILDTVTRGRAEAKRLRYLEFPGIHAMVEKRQGQPHE